MTAPPQPDPDSPAVPRQAAEGAPGRDRLRREGECELLTFRIGTEWYALELGAVTEIVEAPDIRPVPGSADTLRGVFGHRDGLVPLYSGARILGAAGHAQAVALILERGSTRIGLAIDDVDDVVLADLAQLREAPPGVNDDDVVAGLLLGNGRLISVLQARVLTALCTTASREMT